MKFAVWLVVLASCASHTASETMPTKLVSEAELPATCPECPPPRECPPQAVPTTPPCPKPPEPVAADWYCLAIEPPREPGIIHCWPSASVCAQHRREVLKELKKKGKVGSCEASRSVFCFHSGDPSLQARKAVCTGTLEHCETMLRAFRDSEKDQTFSTCRPTLNTDTFTYDGGPVQQP